MLIRSQFSNGGFFQEIFNMNNLPTKEHLAAGRSGKTNQILEKGKKDGFDQLIES